MSEDGLIRQSELMSVKFWGVRGSVPAPMTPQQFNKRLKAAVAHERANPGSDIPAELSLTHGGNTTCVEVVAGGQQFILDMGTGLRELGKAQMPEAFKTKKLSGVILQSHVHWDHIQGFPFWAPLYLPRRQFDCRYRFFGGKSWDSELNAVYRGQMSPPVFPVNLQELETSAMRMEFSTIYDGWVQKFYAFESSTPVVDCHDRSPVQVLARKLNHPQETFGYRIQVGDKAIAFTTDHEPYAHGIPKPLLELVDGVDMWITDCQYTQHDYAGTSGPQKMGWGHSFPEYIAAVASEAKPKFVITTHHDPDADDAKIVEIARSVTDMCKVETRAAFEGLNLDW